MTIAELADRADCSYDTARRGCTILAERDLVLVSTSASNRRLRPAALSQPRATSHLSRNLIVRRQPDAPAERLPLPLASPPARSRAGTAAEAPTRPPPPSSRAGSYAVVVGGVLKRVS